MPAYERGRKYFLADDLAFGKRVINWKQLHASRNWSPVSVWRNSMSVDWFRPAGRRSSRSWKSARRLRRRSRVIVFDEPSAVLTERETRQLNKVNGCLKDEGGLRHLYLTPT